jgi:hypothetical protein
LVNRHQLLHLYKHFEKTFFKEMKPFLPSWQALPPVASLNGTAVVTDRALVRDGQYDAVFRIQFPIDITPAARKFRQAKPFWPDRSRKDRRLNQAGDPAGA